MPYLGTMKLKNDKIMKQSAFLHKSFLLVAMIGWAMVGNAQQYEIEHGRVYFGNELMEYVDVRSFVDLGCGYSKDFNNVYMNGRVLENVDPASFRLKERSAWRHQGKKKDVVEVHRGYYKTKWNVYYGDKKLDAIASSFKELGGGYARDSFNVYYCGEKVEGAWASSFKYTGEGYCEDSFNVYYRGRKLE